MIKALRETLPQGLDHVREGAKITHPQVQRQRR